MVRRGLTPTDAQYCEPTVLQFVRFLSTSQAERKKWFLAHPLRKDNHLSKIQIKSIQPISSHTIQQLYATPCTARRRTHARARYGVGAIGRSLMNDNPKFFLNAIVYNAWSEKTETKTETKTKNEITSASYIQHSETKTYAKT